MNNFKQQPIRGKLMKTLTKTINNTVFTLTLDENGVTLKRDGEVIRNVKTSANLNGFFESYAFFLEDEDFALKCLVKYEDEINN